MLARLLFAPTVICLLLMASSSTFADAPLPEGNYTETCSSCTFDGNKLTCYCPAPDKNEYRRTLDMDLCSRKTVVVKRGLLVCSDEPVVSTEDEKPARTRRRILEEDPRNELPDGDYKTYCKDCRMVEGSLECSCVIESGWWSYWDAWYDASLPLQSCKDPNKVTYAGGLLFCSLQDLLKFHELDKTCRNCRMIGDVLRCECDKSPCGWSKKDRKLQLHINKKAQMNDFRSCNGPLINCNGTLRCGECSILDHSDEFQWKRPVNGTHPAKGYCFPASPFG